MKRSSTHKGLIWGVLLIAAAVNAAGYIWQLYSRFGWFDEAMHFYTPFALTLAAGLLGYGVVLTGHRRHKFLLVLTITALGLALGALWEVAEWGLDQFMHKNVIKGKTDTIIDLILDTAGALVAALLCLALIRDEPDSHLSDGRSGR